MSHPYVNRLGRRYEPDERDYDLADFLKPHSESKAHREEISASKLAAIVKAVFIEVLELFGFKPSPQPTPPPPPGPTPSGAVVWADDEPVLDQGNYGTCVGNGWAQWGNTLPVDDHFVEKDARAIYYEATVIDGSPDNPDAPGGGQQGSTVRSGAKAMRNRSRLSSYAFTTDVKVVIQYLLGQGPVVFGSDWYDEMFSPDASGRVKPLGQVAGGHCYLGIGYDPATDLIECLNSWGAGWGDGGRFYISSADMQYLLTYNGEACASVELA